MIINDLGERAAFLDAEHVLEILFLDPPVNLSTAEQPQKHPSGA